MSRTVVLFLTAVLLLASCTNRETPTPRDLEQQAFDDLRIKVQEIVSDPDRATQAVNLVNQLQQDLADLRSRVAARKERARMLNANYDTTRAQLDAFLASVEQEVRDNQARVSETHQALLASVNAEERAAIRRAHTNAMNSAIASIQAI